MPGACRIGDSNNGGGKITEGVGSVIINGKPVAVIGAKISPHGKGKHASATVVEGSGTVIAEGKGVTFIGAANDCGHSNQSGSGDVIVG